MGGDYRHGAVVERVGYCYDSPVMGLADERDDLLGDVLLVTVDDGVAEGEAGAVSSMVRKELEGTTYDFKGALEAQKRWHHSLRLGLLGAFSWSVLRFFGRVLSSVPR